MANNTTTPQSENLPYSKIILISIIFLLVVLFILIAYNLSFSDYSRKYLGNSQLTYCLPESRGVITCIEIYNPVCGWFDQEKIQCIKYPCAQTYSNSCFSCADENVLYWTEGKCPPD